MILEINNLNKKYDKSILKDLDLTIEETSIIGISGPSGVGKTTLLKIIAGFEHEDSGHICLRGQRVSGKNFIKPFYRQLSYMFQEPCLWPHMTVRENILYANPEDMDMNLLNKLKLNALLDKYPHEISGGEGKRVSLMRACHAKTDIVLMDEPFAYLDEDFIEIVIQILGSLVKEENRTMIIVSHQRYYLKRFVEKLYTLKEGTLHE